MRKYVHNYFDRLVYLYKGSELSRGQLHRLTRHVQKCPECTARFAELRRIDTALQNEAPQQPLIPNPTILTQKILHEILYLKTAEGSTSPVNKFIRWLRLPKVRLSLAGTAIFIIGAFLLQESLILTRITRLEDRIAAYSDVSHNLHHNLLTQIPAEGSINQIQNKFSVDYQSNDEWIRLRRTDLESLVSSYEEQVITNRVLLLILKDHPLLQDITWENGLDKPEVSRLFERRDAIQNYLKTL